MKGVVFGLVLFFAGVGIYLQMKSGNITEQADVEAVAEPVTADEILDDPVEDVSQSPAKIVFEKADMDAVKVLADDVVDDLKQKADDLSTTVLEVSEEMRAKAAEQEQELLELADQYEEVRTDPARREEVRAQMQQKLSAYSENVLPIALEKIQQLQKQQPDAGSSEDSLN